MKVKDLDLFIAELCARYNGGALSGGPYELVPFKEKDRWGGLNTLRGVRLTVKDGGAVLDSIVITGHEPEDWGACIALTRALMLRGVGL